MEIYLDRVTASITDGKNLADISLKIGTNQQWSVIRANGSGKSSLARLCNDLPVISGTRSMAQRAEYVSFAKLGEVLEAEKYHDD